MVEPNIYTYMLPNILGAYIVKKLGSGQCGDVYECVKNGKSLALKTCKNRDKLFFEYRLLMKWDHPSIIRPHCFGISSNGEAFMFMDLYVCNLHVQSLKMSYTQQQCDVLQAKLVDALRYIEHTKTMHGDIHLHNILVGEDPMNIVLIDPFEYDKVYPGGDMAQLKTAMFWLCSNSRNLTKG